MAKRAKPAWGNLGVICIKGHGQTDDQLFRRGMVPGKQRRGDRGCVLSDEQFDRLAIHLNLIDPNQMMEVRAHLNSIDATAWRRGPRGSGEWPQTRWSPRL